MKNFLVALTLLLGFNLSAQTGYIKGRVIDAETNEPIIQAPIYDKSKKNMTLSNFDGEFILPINEGEYQFECKYVGYQPDSVLLDIKAGDTIYYDFKMYLLGALKAVEVVGKRSNNSAVATLAEEKNAKTVTDGISKEEMTNRDVSTAADAVKQVPGATVEGGKYVYVRGLSDRYSKTLLNGADIPGLDPNRNSVQMDLFPSALLQNIVVHKAFSPDLPGSFTGGLVNIKTKEFPSTFTVYFSAKFGYNTQSSLNNNFLTQGTNSLDFLGFGASSRLISSDITSISTADFPTPSTNSTLLNEYGKEINSNFNPTSKLSGINSSYTFTVGNSINLNKDKSYPKMGYFVGLSYKKTYDYYDNGIQGRYKLTGDYSTSDFLNTEIDLNDTRATETVLWGALGNMSIQLNEKNTVSLVVNRFQNGINSSRYLEGNNYSDANDLFFQTRTLYYQQRELSNGQLKGEHYLSRDADYDRNKTVKFNWIGSYTMSVQKTPELKYFTNDYTVSSDGDTLYDLQPALYAEPARFTRVMKETNLNGKVDFEIPFAAVFDTEETKNKFKVGAYYLHKNRSFTELRYDFVTQSGSDMDYTGDVDAYMSDDNFDSPNYSEGFLYVQNASEQRNNYTGYEYNYAGYVMADITFLEDDKLEVLTGVRGEYSDIYAKSGNSSYQAGTLQNFDILPSLNTTYHLVKDTLKLRLGYSRTLARPTFRELAPFTSFDFVGGNVFVGNPDLKRTLIDNFDLRLEYYPTYRENFSFGLFYKNFQNPIERAFNPEAASAELTWKNVDQATVFGAELEFSKRLAAADGPKFIKNIALGGNFTFVKSIVNIPDSEYEVILAQDPDASSTREMYGQSPYIINAFVNYKDRKGYVANVNFGVSGKQISVVTIGATPNVYQLPRPMLGANISKDIKSFNVKLSATNLLNSKYINTYDFKGTQYVFSSYTVGRTFSVKVAYTFEKKDK